MVNRRKFFEDYASENQFDPLVPENWYYQSIDNIISKKVFLFTIYFLLYKN